MATYVSSTTYFGHGDWLGTERARTDVNGAISETCQGLPFGDGLSCSGSDVSPLHFTGKQRDSETGLDYFGAHYDSSSVGRFMTPDWSAKVEPVPYAKLGDPQSLNLYTYVMNNPVTDLDAYGHRCGATGPNGCITPPPAKHPKMANRQGGAPLNWSLSWQISTSSSFLGQELAGVADATIEPLITAVEHPVDTAKGVGHAVAHPVQTAEDIANGAVSTVKAAANGNPRAIGEVVAAVATVAYAAENVRPRLYENTGGGGLNFYNTPTEGSRIGLDVHGIPEADGGVRPHIDITIKKPGIPSGPGSNLINIKHWPW